jgi:hypothetical protein
MSTNKVKNGSRPGKYNLILFSQKKAQIQRQTFYLQRPYPLCALYIVNILLASHTALI